MDAAAGRKKILIMDDEEMIGEVACQMLTLLGYEGRHVFDGKEAISLYRQHLEAGDAFAAVIMDLTIPRGMGGKEAVIELLALDPQARVLVSSGYSNDPSMTNFSRYGFCGHIEKPFDLMSLKAAIEAVL
ncbi:response regulator [Desulfoprunum benzoelyticum]|uniref:DNA-binding NtrC family response regulator n=1 Tax=Desulfoprunum benzoelyticum TaxID=1506996 RepID=A0A840UWA8_9BACT|nr:DNA-binding NtrC family response regulator [Desulfoprunum benzoelyticum]MBM9530645.1 response regulator [Desulfoprunum benzoelyticum]